ncbi:uncharacterized protein Z518_01178 [Rhinocladiella mackenziei CBS 650.93]|uniref:Mitochondrial import inner membrane translocase subunit n=1 Tax=Rhinocladiella mackenziei CBS 650.93 TaxID=1442369 RepID=A0A0D2G5I2_9EURO|nr:uncharacterized protein Z518_01178 [Rhinocladiella mackenziei CBS 650.93]KIX10097.1 hypothetical protein Z518_01178 [Rhinocladiella mackenziei CBS 650.93]
MADAELNINQEDLTRLTPGQQRELRVFLESESQKAQIQSTIHDLTDVCFKKCITGSMSTGKLTTKEENCMANCVERFLDSHLAILKHLDTLRQSQ